MSTLTLEGKVVEKEGEWIDVMKKEFARAVKALKWGEVPSNLKPKTDRLTHGEWLAVLEAARREVTKDGR